MDEENLWRIMTRDETETAIRSILEQLSLNVQSVSYVGGGTVVNGSPENARKSLRGLYSHLDFLDGKQRSSSGGPKFWTLVSRRF